MSAAPGAAQQTLPIDSDLADPLLEAVARSNPGLIALRRALSAAEARLQAAGFAPPAVLSGEIEEVPGGTDLSGAGFRIEIGKEFLTGGRSAAARALAAADLRSAEAALHAAELRIWAAAARALTRAIGWSAIERRLASEDSLLIGAEEALRGRFSVGGARYTDVLRLRTERVRVQTDRAEAVAEARVGVAALEGLLGEGLPAATPVVTAVYTSAPSAHLLDDLPEPPDLDSLIHRSGRVAMAIVGVERAEAQRDAVRASQRPRIAAALGAQRVEAADGGFAIGPTLGLSVTLPFTARRAYRAEAEAEERALVAAQAELAAARAEVRADLVAARTRYEAARERLAVFDRALLEGVRQERESALAAYRTGEISLIELLDFERALTRAEIERRRAHIDAVLALADLVSGAAGASQNERGGSSALSPE
ncbi:MAG: TolC family protein [Longimicrobiales bacterium]